MKKIAFLGVPVFTLDSEEIAEEIASSLKAAVSQGPIYLAPLNLDQLANVHHYFSYSIENLELLQVNRLSMLTSTETALLHTISWMLGRPIPIISFKEIISRLFDKLEVEGKTIYILGEEEAADKTSEWLRAEHPHLRIFNSAAPFICIKGAFLSASPDRDALLIEQINAINPDLLIIALGTPKQEIWFNRVARRLKVPVCLGVGGALDQPSQLSLIQKIQHPSKWIWNPLKNLIKILTISTPLILYHYLNQFVSSLKKSSASSTPRLFLSRRRTLAVILLPQQLCKDQLSKLQTQIEEALSQDAIVLDFRQTCHADLEGINFLTDTWSLCQERNKPLFGLGIKGDFRLLLKLHRVWDLISDQICTSPQELMARLETNKKNKIYLYEAISQKGNTVIIAFFGKLDKHQSYGDYLQKLSPMLIRKNVILDFNYCTFIDNSGFCFLLQLRHLIISGGYSIYLQGVSNNLSNQFRSADLWKLFKKKSSS